MSREPGSLFLLVRRYARKPPLRHVAEPLAAAYFALRDRKLDAVQRWQRGSTFEVAHWDEDWLADARRNGLLDADAPLNDALVVRVVDDVVPGQEVVRILDVGAGPLTPLGKVHPRRRIAITATDALAAEYDALLARAGVEPPVRTVLAEGEKIADTFGPESFDLVHCGNALDHHYDPMRALEQMFIVTAKSGAVVLNHFPDEGEHERYLGMHQWNISERDGHLVIWNRSETHDVNERFAGRATVRCAIVDTGRDRPRVQAVLTKT